MNDDSRFTMSVSEAARHAGLSEGTIRNWAARGKLKCVRRGPKQTRYFDPAQVHTATIDHQLFNMVRKQHMPPMPAKKAKARTSQVVGSTYTKTA